MNWSGKEERRLAEIRAEVAELQRRRDAAANRVEELLNRCWDAREDRVSSELVIQFADQIRDALAPFDSGVREGK